MKKAEMEMMMKMMSMMMGIEEEKKSTTKKPRGAMAIYEIKSEFDREVFEEIAEEMGVLFTSKNGKKFVGATYENGVEVASRRENVAKVYREMDARAEAEGKIKPKSEDKPSKLEDMSKEELIAMIKALTK